MPSGPAGRPPVLRIEDLSSRWAKGIVRSLEPEEVLWVLIDGMRWDLWRYFREHFLPALKGSWRVAGEAFAWARLPTVTETQLPWLTDPARRPGGVLFRYEGSPSWILATVEPPYRDSIARAEVVARDGRRIPLRSFELVDGTWGGSLPIRLDDVAAVHLVDSGGRSVLVADF